MLRRTMLAVGSMLAAVLALPAHAQSYPAKPITVYQGFAVGGNADAIARVVTGEMGKIMNQTFVVESRAGAGGTIAAGAVARAPADGYTLLLATGGHAVAGALYHQLSYETVSGFEMVSTVTAFPFLLVVRNDSPYASLGDVLAAARTDAQRVSYGTAGVGTTHHLAGELLVSSAGAPMLHVPYRGDAASVTALLGGEIALIIAPPTAVMQNIAAGNLRAIATTGGQRWNALPELSTVQEQGVPGYEVTSWAGLLAPAGTPRAVVDQLNAATRQALQAPAVQARLEDMGGQAIASTPEEMAAMVEAEVQKWTRVVQEANIPKQ